MKRKLISLLAGLSLFLMTTLPALAMFERGEKYAFIGDDEVVNDDLFIMAEEVLIEGLVNGDVFALGAEIVVTGTINGDLYALAPLIDVSGIVSQDLIVLGDAISLDDAQIGDGMLAASNLLSLDSDSSIGGGLVYAASKMNMDASVGRGVLGASSNTSMKGQVGKNVLLATEQLSILPEAYIQGNLKYVSQDPTEVDQNNVGGSIEHVMEEGNNIAEERGFDKIIGNLSGQAWSYFAALVVGCLFIAFLPKFYHRTGKEVMEHPVLALIYGFFFFLGLPILSAFLMLTVIGVPLAVIGLIYYLLGLYIGKIFVASVFAAALSQWTKWKWLKKWNEFVIFAIMLLIYYVLKNTPYIGVAVQGISLLLAWGAVIMTSKEAGNILKKAKL